MNTLYNLQVEKCNYTPQQFTQIINGWKAIPLTTRIFVRGRLEVYNLQLKPNYFPDQLKRRAKRNNSYKNI